MLKKAILLLNLGTPDHCDKKSVRRYLKEFLSDSRVIDLPSMLRWFLVNIIILPFRTRKTTVAYQKIWLPSGSPLLLNTKQLCDALAKELGDSYQVEFGMRYGTPTIESALSHLKDSNDLTVIPLFPQYTSAATGSAIEKLLEPLAKTWNIPEVNIQRDFYNDPGFIAAFTDLIRKYTADKQIDLILFSYHGLPERHIKKSACLAHCDHLKNCPLINHQNLYCYRAQCFATTQLIAEQLHLQPHQYAVSFQSRLGRTPWIKPYTDLLLPELVKKGIKRIAVVSPSFVADCLETLEEINIRMRQQWHDIGGDDFVFIPCLNDSKVWVKALAEMIKK